MSTKRVLQRQGGCSRFVTIVSCHTHNWLALYHLALYSSSKMVMSWFCLACISQYWSFGPGYWQLWHICTTYLVARTNLCNLPCISCGWKHENSLLLHCRAKRLHQTTWRRVSSFPRWRSMGSAQMPPSLCTSTTSVSATMWVCSLGAGWCPPSWVSH